MKICPFITQASILEDKDLLFREVDNVEIAKEGAAERPAKEDVIFINPAPKPENKQTLLDEIAPPIPVRFIAKSYRGEVECLGEMCRFHDDNANTCRIELMLADAAGEAKSDESTVAALRCELEQSREQQRESAHEMTSLITELGAKNESRASEFASTFEQKLDELKSLVEAADHDRRETIEALSLTLDAKTEEIERKIDANDTNFKSLKDELSSWKGALGKTVDGITTELDEHRKLVNELSDNHSGIMQLVETQKKSIEEEEKKRRGAEARRLNNAGVMAYHNGQYEKALDLFKKALTLDPAMTEAYNNLGLTHTEINEEEKATDAFKKAIELSPDLAAAYNNLGFVFYRLGSYEEAIQMYNEAIGRSKDNSSAYTNLGNAYYKLDKVEEAIDAWKKALAIDPANEKARRNLKRFHAEVK